MSGSVRVGIGLGSRGHHDGMSGATPASESMEYGAEYIRGRAIDRVEAGGCFLVIGLATSCPRCGCVFAGDATGCGCDVPGPVSMVRGVYALEGPDPLGHGPCFLSNGDARQKIAMGLSALDIHGHDVSCDIQLIQ